MYPFDCADDGSLPHRSTVPIAVLVGLCLSIAAALGAIVDTWRIRRNASRLLAQLESVFPVSVPLYTAPNAEYAATWTVPPPVARQRLQEEFGFEPTLLSQLQGYTRGDTPVYEAGNYVYYPNGRGGRWQLHVRLFPAPGGYTEVWAHWELSVFSAPLSHCAGEKLDAKKGKRCIYRRLEAELIRPEESSKDGPL